ncbi:hypothetical protein [Nonomuraea candida]|uniref:hypothetical protein n=1 Tax=Nonomuraea candida TaxID=359159 RepID=UPI000694B3D8|nr:hypothetical protein [Nonomuraea candida]
MRITTTDTAYYLDSGHYRLTVSRTDASAELEGWMTLSLLASVGTGGGRDETYETLPPVLAERDGVAVFDFPQRTTEWEAKTVRLTCTPETIALEVRVEGDGVLAGVTLMGGRAVLNTRAAGTFRSAVHAAGVFSPTPAHPVRVVRPVSVPVALTVVGDASPGRLHAVFSPPPLLLAFCKREPDGPTAVPDGPWLAASVRAGIAGLTFTELTYEPLDGGALLRFDYECHTEVRGSWTSPAVVFRAAASPWEALSWHRADLVGHGLAPAGPARERHAWWSGPIFCGWGAQCARAGTGPPAELSRRDLYDEWLAGLERHGIVPGTIVIDDRWQRTYGGMEVDEAKWPALGEWIAERHARGQRVLLWWRAWSADGLPPQECVTDAAGRPVAADPSNPAYRLRVRAVMERLLGGLGADGFKIDFTQWTPSGTHLKAYGSAWGIALLHELLATMYEAAKSVKPDALMVTHTPHPAFGAVTDMIRLNDVLERDARGAPVPAVDQLRHRHAVVAHAMPHHLIDTDQWPMPSRAGWLAYARAQPSLGVPALYYAEAIDTTLEPVTGDDLRRVAAWWRGG